MKQMSLGESGFERKTKRTRKRELLDERNLVVPWAELVALIAPHTRAPVPRAVARRLRWSLAWRRCRMSDLAALVRACWASRSVHSDRDVVVNERLE